MSDMTRSGHKQFLEAGERKYQEQKSKTPTVKTVQDTGGTAALLVLDDGSKPIWTPDRELARTLLGKPIPADWLMKPNKQGTGNIALPPKKGGGGGYRQSKEAFESEAASRRAWQEIEEEKKDRRTALMQAVAVAQNAKDQFALDVNVIQIAELYYDWLRESSPAAGPALAGAGVATTEVRPSPPPQAGASTSVAAEREELGQDPDTPAASGEVAVGQAPGGQTKPPGVYPLRPEDCTHRAASGRWLPTKQSEGVPICPRCGMSAVLYRETA